MLPVPGISGDLRDYRLFGETYPRPQDPSQRERPPISTYDYDEFRRDIKGLTPEQKKNLRKFLFTKRDAAREQKDQFEYYSSLIVILEETK